MGVVMRDDQPKGVGQLDDRIGLVEIGIRVRLRKPIMDSFDVSSQSVASLRRPDQVGRFEAGRSFLVLYDPSNKLKPSMSVCNMQVSLLSLT